MEVLETGEGNLFLTPDPDGDREFIRANKSMALKDKLMSESDAVSRFINPGDYIGFELYGFVRCPMSIAREVVRQGIDHLRAAGQGIMEVDILLAAGLIDKLDLTYLGHEVYGISRVLRRAAEGGKIEIVEWSNAALAWRLKAATLGVPFLPVRSMLGTDTFKHSAAKTAIDPFTGMKVCLLPASMLDVGVIHVHRADKYGNCQLDGIGGFAKEMAGASRRLIISAEEIIDTDEIRKYPERTIIPYYLVDAVVHAPFGSHPGEMYYNYWRDEDHLAEYIKATQTEEATNAYIDKYIRGVSNNEEYLELVGGKQLMADLASKATRRD